MDTFQFGEAGRQIYDFFWSEFCDWYLEISKIAIYRGTAEAKARTQAVLIKVLDESLRLLHPFIPFVTEETWGYLKQAVGDGRSASAAWPAGADHRAVARRPAMRDEAAEADMGLIMDMVRGDPQCARRVRREAGPAAGGEHRRRRARRQQLRAQRGNPVARSRGSIRRG